MDRQVHLSEGWTHQINVVFLSRLDLPRDGLPLGGDELLIGDAWHEDPLLLIG